MKNILKVKIKKTHPSAEIPSYAKPGDAGMDITAISKSKDKMGNVCYGTGLAFEIPEGHVMLLFSRSSICKTDLLLTNAVGVVDSGYRGEISLKFLNASRNNIYLGEAGTSYEVGDRIGQAIILPYPEIQFEEVEELTETERGTAGYGSTGK